MTLLSIWCACQDSRHAYPPLGSSICQLVYLRACCKMTYRLTLSLHRHTKAPHPHGLYLPDVFGPTKTCWMWGIQLLLSPAWSLLLNERCTHPCTPVLRVIQTLAPLTTKVVPGMWAVSHGTASAATTEPVSHPHQNPSRQHSDLALTHVEQRVRSCRTTVCNKKDELWWSAAGLHQKSVIMAPFYMQPAPFVPFSISLPLHSSLLPLPLHIPSSACIAPLTPFHLHSPSGLQSPGLLAASW